MDQITPAPADALMLSTVEAVIGFGQGLAASLKAGDVLALCGPMGAGKTHVIKGLVAGLGCEAEVSSPTFGLVHEYRDGRLAAYHFDFYRLDSAAEALSYGWDDYLDSGGVCVVEWADLFPDLLPPHTRWLTLGYAQDDQGSPCGRWISDGGSPGRPQ